LTYLNSSAGNDFTLWGVLPILAGEGVASRRKWQASRCGLTGTFSSGNGGAMKGKTENAKILGPTLSPIGPNHDIDAI
jgi:hypothetical protein